jgi:hypothetical protein
LLTIGNEKQSSGEETESVVASEVSLNSVFTSKNQKRTFLREPAPLVAFYKPPPEPILY